MDDLYKVLGVEKTARADEIKKAYRNMAFKYHPDRNPNDKVAEEKFKQVNSAYSVLGDETKRRQYDMYGSSFENSGAGRGTYGNGFYRQQNSYSGDPFTDFFGEGFDSSNKSYSNKHYTYTYTTQHAEGPKGRKAFPLFLNALLQMGASFILYIFIGRWFFIISILCLVGFFRGVSDAFNALKLMFTK